MPVNIQAPARPIDKDGYKLWLRAAHEVAVDDQLRAEYAVVTDALRQQFETSAFWLDLRDALREEDALYYQRTTNHMFDGAIQRDVVVKPFDSFLEKTLRKNVLGNTSFPGPPEGGWWLPPNWYERVTDLVRTTIVVDYVDAVRPVMRLADLTATKAGHRTRTSLEGTPAGYYAGHLDVLAPVEVNLIGTEPSYLVLSVELQITTQLQHNIKTLLHRNYEQARLLATNEDWRWTPGSLEFRTNYLGHVLHYLEGMIVNERDAPITTD